VRVLVANAGSSSLKLSLLDSDDSELWAHELAAPRAVIEQEAVADGLAELLTALAPLHQPKSLAAVEAVSLARPRVPAVACFDTAFHASLPAEAATYALPRHWRERYGVRRYGFHGLSHSYAARRASELAPTPRRLVSCHLGAGASLCAVLDGRSVDTTMGFTPLEGLAMATRSGSVDPGLLLWLQQHEGLSVGEMADALEHDSGLLGLAGTSDMRELLARDDSPAQLALGVYIHRLRAGIGAMAATLGGLDGLVFTGGVGERAARVRELACEGLSHLGIAIDASRNDGVNGDADVRANGSGVAVLVVRAREDLEIARQARAALRPQFDP
jgi:acetate kinase